MASKRFKKKSISFRLPSVVPGEWLVPYEVRFTARKKRKEIPRDWLPWTLGSAYTSWLVPATSPRDQVDRSLRVNYPFSSKNVVRRINIWSLRLVPQFEFVGQVSCTFPTNYAKLVSYYFVFVCIRSLDIAVAVFRLCISNIGHGKNIYLFTVNFLNSVTLFRPASSFRLHVSSNFS